MNIWQWLYDSVEEHRERGDDSRLELYWIFRESSDIGDPDPEAAFAVLETGRARAAALGDGWWTLFFEHWKLQNLLHKQRDYTAARDLAARVALEARKPAYAAFPQRVCLQEDLITSFVGIDARGHARVVEEALDYMEREAARDAECYQCLQGLRRDFVFDCGRAEDALALGRRALAEAERTQSDHHLFQALLSQCELALEAPYGEDELLDPATLQEGDAAVPVHEGWVAPARFEARLREVEAMALRAQEIAHKMDDHTFDPEIEMWLAHARFFLDRGEEAKLHFERAMEGFQSHGRLPSEYFFRAWLMTYWRFGALEQCLHLVQDEERWIEGHGQLGREAKLARQTCSFKLMLDTLQTSDIERARQKIALLGAPEYESGRLDALETAWKERQANPESEPDAEPPSPKA